MEYVGDAGVYGGDAGVYGGDAGVYGGDAGVYGGDAGVYGGDAGVYGGDAGVYGGEAGVYGGDPDSDSLQEYEGCTDCCVQGSSLHGGNCTEGVLNSAGTAVTVLKCGCRCCFIFRLY